MVHKSEEHLDEREIQILLNALRRAYTGFTVICLIIIYGFAIAENEPINVLIAGALLYLAHTLPAAIVGWNEKVIELSS